MDTFIRYLGTPNWDTQHGWRRAIWQGLARFGLTGLHGLPVHKGWMDIHHRDMPMVGLDPWLHGKKIVQISDVHYSPVVWSRYLRQCVGFINGLQPDLICITGDLISGGYRYARRVATLLSELKAPLGVICTFGNHDYSMFGRFAKTEGTRRADFLEQCLLREDFIVLRNSAYRLKHDNMSTPLTIVGLDDDWSGSIDPAKAFAGVDDSETIICLNHNPATCPDMLKYPWQWMLSGHTHGRQLGASNVTKRLYGRMKRAFTHGYYSVGGRHLYVNKGLSYGQRFKHWCRPEVTVFTLKQSEPDRA